MKPQFVLSAAAVALIAIASPSRAEDTPLGKQMEIIGKATKGLKKAGEDFAKGEQLAKDAIEAAKKSRELVPAKVEKMSDAAAKAAATEDYKKQMDGLVQGFEAVQAACAAKDAAKLQEAMEALGKAKKTGHDAFMEEED